MSRSLLFIDASSGASGDMILGALFDLGVPVAPVRRALETLAVEGWRLQSKRMVRCGIACRKVDVRVRHDTRGRGWNALRRIVRSGGLSPGVRDRALAIFRRLIDAEAEAHGMAPDTIHLHEAGGVDAIVDVVGTCVALEHLGDCRIVVSPMTTGSGSIECQHGLYPVPGPATLLLVRGFPVRAGTIEVERLTPTGAAILTTLADEWNAMPLMEPRAIGYGAGTRDLTPCPNMLRMVHGEMPHVQSDLTAEVGVVECNVDDSNPQVLAHAAQRLLENGALDVFTTPLTMKKGRPGHLVTVLARPERIADLARQLLLETRSLGVRFRIEERIELDRREQKVQTPHGRVRMKVAVRGERVLWAWPEYEDCAKLARRSGLPLHEIQQAALLEFRSGSPHPRTDRGKSRVTRQEKSSARRK